MARETENLLDVMLGNRLPDSSRWVSEETRVNCVKANASRRGENSN